MKEKNNTKKDKSYLAMIIPYILRFKRRVIISLLLIVVGRLLSVANPYIIKELVDSLAESSNTDIDIMYLVYLIIFFFLFRWGMDVIGGIKEHIFAKVTVSVKKFISLDVFQHLLSLPVQFHTDQATGGVTRKIARGTGALSSLSFFLTGSILPTLIEIALVMGVFIILFPPIFSIVFLVFVIIYVTYTVIVTNRRQELLLETNARDDEGSEKSVDALMNYETVKYFTSEKFEYDRYLSSLEKWSDVAIKSVKKGANLNIGQGFILTAGLTVLLGLAVREYLDGNATLGDFVLITTYLNRIAIPLSFLGSLYRSLKESFANVDAMFQLMDVKNEVVDKKTAGELAKSLGNIQFENVVFGYNEDRKIIKNLSIDIPSQSSVAFVGTSGSGKSTIGKLLLRLYDIQGGKISIDNIDITDVTQTSLRQNIGVVAQDTILFNDTIFNNIAYGKSGAEKNEIITAAKLAHIHDFIETLPKGYQTEVGERGVKLSGGEKQRVAIARMLLKNPEILLFDEATASLDSTSEKIIQDAIKSISKEGKTTIVIAHRLSTIMDFDKIVVLNKGKIEEEGTHVELLKNKGMYHTLWSTQKGHK